MSGPDLRAVVSRLESEGDLNSRALLLAALVSEAFRARGFEPVVVGGSAIEFYTDGAYMSGDTDLCWKGPSQPTPRDRADVMAAFPCTPSGTRSWKIAGLFIDLLGEITTYAELNYTALTTPLGRVTLQPVEDLMVERIFAARCWAGPNAENEACARKLVAAALSGHFATDWAEVCRIANLPAYDCGEVVENMVDEIAGAMNVENPISH